MKKLALGLLFAVLLVPVVPAEGSPTMQNGYCESQPQAAVGGLTRAGTVVGCLEPYPAIVRREMAGGDGAGADQIQLMASMRGPDIVSGTTVAFTWAITFAGCTIGAAGSQAPAQLDHSNTLGASSVVGWVLGTFTQPFCRGYITGEVDVTSALGATTRAANFRFNFNIQADTSFSYVINCKATEANIPNDYATTGQPACNASSDFGQAVVDWFPVWLGIVLLFLAVSRREGVEPNALMIAGVLFATGAIVCPFPGHPDWIDPIGIALRVATVGVAIWCWLRYGSARRDWNTGEDDK